MQGDMHMDRRERQRRCSGQPTPLPDKVLAAENSRNPLSQMRRTVSARNTRWCRTTRERTHILTLMRLLPLALPGAALYRHGG
jgi:hypothetical protein